MDKGKNEALVSWVNATVYDADVTKLTELANKSTILLEIIKKIDTDITVVPGSHEKNIDFACKYVQGIFNPDVVDGEEVKKGNELEIAKLCCFLLELALTGSNNMEFIEKIQSFHENTQRSIMSMTQMVSQNSDKINLAEIMKKTLRKSVSDETGDNDDQQPAMSTLFPSPSKSSPQAFQDSPQYCSPLSISTEATSPLLLQYASSPQARYRRVMVENTKLKQKVRHSELFLKRKSQFEEQIAFDVETEREEVITTNKRLLKEQEQFQQKMHSLQNDIVKLKEEIEFLQLEVQSKDKEIAEQLDEKKKSNEVITQLHDTVDLCSEMEKNIQKKQALYEEELKKNSNFDNQVNVLEKQNSCLRTELIQSNENMEKLKEELRKKREDYDDQIEHLNEEISKLEKQALKKQESQQESLLETLQRDKDISTLKEQNEGLRNTITANTATIVNMGYEQERTNKAKKKSEEDVVILQNEVASLKKKCEELSESNKKQSNQYMDQISTLLKQVEEHAERNQGLNIKITRADEKYKQLEQQISNFEKSEQKINDQILVQGKELKERNERLQTLSAELEDRNKELERTTLNKRELEVTLKLVNEEKSRLVEIEKLYNTLLVEVESMKQSKIIDVSQIDDLKNKIDEIKQINMNLNDDNKRIAVLETIIKDGEAEKERLMERSIAISEEKSYLSDRSKSIEKERARIQELLDVSLNNNCNMEKKVKLLEDEVKHLTENCNTLQNKITTSKDKIDLLSNETHQLEQKLHGANKMKQATDDSLARIADEKEDLVKTLDALTIAKRKLEEQCFQMSNDSTQIENLTKDIEMLREKNQQIDVLGKKIIQVQNENAKLQQSELKLKEVLEDNENKKNVENECEALRKENKALKKSKEEAMRLNDVKYQILVNENQRLGEYEKSCQELNTKLSESNKEQETLQNHIQTLNIQVANNNTIQAKSLNEKIEMNQLLQTEIDSQKYNHGILHAEVATLKNVKSKMDEQLINLQDEITMLKLDKKRMVTLESEIDELKNKNMKLNEDKELLQEKEKRLIEEQKKPTSQEPSPSKSELAKLKKSLKQSEKLFGEEKLQLIEQINETEVECQAMKDLLTEKEQECLDIKGMNEELSEEIDTKNKMVLRLEDRCLEEKATVKQYTTRIRSLEAQLSSSDATIRDLRKDLKNQQSLDDEPIKQPLSRNTRRSKLTEVDTSGAETDKGVLQIAELQTATSKKAEEIFQRSRSMRARERRSIIALPSTQEETESSDTDGNPMLRTYSLRQKAERRRSFQPRRYMSGRTPPRRRTLVGDPSQLQMNTFSTDVAEEPDEMDNNQWGMIACLKESSSVSDEKQGFDELSDENRLTELQRRNTLCLPHLKSSYPMELSVPKSDETVPETLVKSSQASKRKINTEDAPRGTFKKWKTDHALRSSSDQSNFKRSTYSDSTLQRNTRLSPRVELQDVSATERPTKSSIAFEITMEPPKNSRPRFPRSTASGNLKAENSTTKPPLSTRTTRSTLDKPPTKPSTLAAARLIRNESKRNSFSRVTQRMAASLKGKKPTKMNAK